MMSDLNKADKWKKQYRNSSICELCSSSGRPFEAKEVHPVRYNSIGLGVAPTVSELLLKY